VLSNPRPSEALNWVVRDDEEQRRLKGLIFDELVSVDPDTAFYVHFDEETGMLMMPEHPGAGDAERLQAWEETRARLSEFATSLAGREVRSFVKDDRYYRLRFRRFDADDWRGFQEGFSELPGWMKSSPGEDLARWYGVNETYPPFVWGSVEDFGYEVFGVLLPEQWHDWHGAFMELIDGLPAMTESALEVVEDHQAGSS
jgi:hypothetical protein